MEKVLQKSHKKFKTHIIPKTIEQINDIRKTYSKTILNIISPRESTLHISFSMICDTPIFFNIYVCDILQNNLFNGISNGLLPIKTTKKVKNIIKSKIKL